MRTNKQTNILLTLLITLLSLNLSCKKEMTSEISLKSNLTLSEKPGNSYQDNKKYINIRLAKTADIITKLSHYKEFRTIVNEMVAKKFDGDYNVLLKDLIKAFPQVLTKKKLESKTTSSILAKTSGRDPADPIDPQQSISTILEELQEDLEIPFVINGQTVYPQIYIPFSGSEALQTGDLNPCDAPSYMNYTYPVVVSYDGDESTGQIVFTGNSYDPFGQPITVQVSECFASQHTVWAVTINERVNQNGTVPNPTSGTTPSSSTITPTGADLYIPNLTIKTHKESWLKGGSEIQMQCGISWSNGINPSNNLTNQFLLYKKSFSQYVTNELDIKFFKRKQIKNEQSIDVDFTYAPLSTWGYSINVPHIVNNVTTYNPEIQYYNYPTKGDYIYLIIYEYDNHFWEFFSGNGTSYSGESYGFTDASNNYLSNYYIKTNNSPYLVTSMKIAPKNSAQNTPNTSNTDINTDQIIFKSRHRN